mmetsp:Transcript_90803/g.189843  ORF Transcript_90803/g.189843 Transcript_90803/m.189843 type:complete len:153 (-) Transcript_90803:294-752(-)
MGNWRGLEVLARVAKGRGGTRDFSDLSSPDRTTDRGEFFEEEVGDKGKVGKAGATERSGGEGEGEAEREATGDDETEREALGVEGGLDTGVLGSDGLGRGLPVGVDGVVQTSLAVVLSQPLLSILPQELMYSGLAPMRRTIITVKLSLLPFL